MGWLLADASGFWLRIFLIFQCFGGNPYITQNHLSHFACWCCGELLHGSLIAGCRKNSEIFCRAVTSFANLFGGSLSGQLQC